MPKSTFTSEQRLSFRSVSKYAWWLCGVFILWLSSVSAHAFNTVILDAGHGGHDRGAAIGYVFEKHLALDTTRRVEAILRAQGVKVVMTRRGDYFIPLEGRSRINNSINNAIFVSIHYNSARSASGQGLETFYCHRPSYQLAAFIQAYMIQETRMQNRGVKHANFHVIRVPQRNPSVLVECGFVSNPNERNAMMSGQYRDRIAKGIAKGILAYRRAR